MCKAKSELLKNNTRIVSRVEEYKDTSVETRARKTFEVANTNEKGGQTSTLWTGPSSSATLYAELRAHLSFTLLSDKKGRPHRHARSKSHQKHRKDKDGPPNQVTKCG